MASGADNGTVRISARFTSVGAVRLDQATLTLTDLLNEVSGVGELTSRSGGDALLPLVLHAREGSKLNDAVYQTARGVRPSVKVEIKRVQARTGRLDLSVSVVVDRAEIPQLPVGCAGAVSIPPLSGRASPSTMERTRRWWPAWPALGGASAAAPRSARREGPEAHGNHRQDMSSPDAADR